MTDVTLLENDQLSGSTSYVSTLFDKIEKIIHDHRQKDPDLYRIVEEQKLIQAAKQAARVCCITSYFCPISPFSKF